MSKRPPAPCCSESLTRIFNFAEYKNTVLQVKSRRMKKKEKIAGLYLTVVAVIICQCIQPADDFFWKKYTRPVEEQLKEHGVVVVGQISVNFITPTLQKGTYPIAEGGGVDCAQGVLDFLPVGEDIPLRASLQDVFDDLGTEGETPEEKERRVPSVVLKYCFGPLPPLILS